MKTYQSNGRDRKEMAARLAEITGLEKKYSGVPKCTYLIGPYTIEKNGSLNVKEKDEDAEVISTLAAEGWIIAETADTAAETETAAEPAGTADETTEDPSEENTEENGEDTQEADTLGMLPDDGGDILKPDIAFPAGSHTGPSIRNLINLLYSRGALVSKSTGGEFSAEEGLVEALKDDQTVLTVDSALKAIEGYEAENGKAHKGITITKEKVTFDGFPPEGDPGKIRAFMDLASAMNKQAISQSRIQPKVVEDVNEKYIYRIWLVRIGLDKKEYKETRRYLLENLEGHTAFHTPADAEKWKARQKEKKEELKKQKEENGSEDTGEDA